MRLPIAALAMLAVGGPEVATVYPRVSRGGKTLTFAIRPGFRFSNGAPVRASAFARTINRELSRRCTRLECST
jgi:ABC-type transport system substrate-binding protein